MSIHLLSAREIAQKVKSKDLSAREVLAAFQAQVEKVNSKVNAVVSFNEQAVQQAQIIDDKIKNGEKLGRLAGVPVLAKDMFCQKGVNTSAASKVLENYKPPYTATVIERLETEGAIVFAKTNQDEFAMGSSNENSIYGVCRNPWNLEYVPGGSSGGAAASAASRMAPISLGTDTGGSIRQPASFCGVYGVKPTYGRVSRHGIIAFASSLDQAGPLTHDLEDVILSSEIISGHCPFDSTSSRREVPAWSKERAAAKLKVGLPKEYFTGSVRSDCKSKFESLVKKLEADGHTVVEVSLPKTKYVVPIYYIVATCEASSNLARYDGVRYGFRANFSDQPAGSLEEFYSRTRGEAFGDEVKRRIVLGTFALSSGYYDAYYSKACKVRRLIKDDFDTAFQKCDVILGPVTTGTAFKVGEKISDPLEMYMNDIFTISANLVGLPGMSLPLGIDDKGLPLGVQLMSNAFDETSMFHLAREIDRIVDFKEVPDVI